MTGHEITAADYAYSPEMLAVAVAEREVLGRQLGRLRNPTRFDMERNRLRRLGSHRFQITRREQGTLAPAYVSGRWIRRSPGSPLGFEVVEHHHSDREFSDPAASPEHVVAQGPVMKGDTSPEPTGRRFVFGDDIVADIRDNPPARVAVVDTGLTAEVRHDRWLASLDRSPDNLDVLDSADDTDTLLDLGAGHGTFVAGIVQQVCPTADITVYRALESDGLGSESQVAQMLLQAAADHDIVTMSLGTLCENGRRPEALRIVLERIKDAHPDVLVIAAAGNEGSDREMWPAAFKSVVAVGALTADLAPAEWSSRGYWVDCATVGEGIVSTFVDGTETAESGGSVFGPDSWALWSGTSFTAPQVAGGVARAMQANPGWTPRQAYAALVAGAPSLPGYGRVLHLLPGTARPGLPRHH
jgi:subtilisin family serine protease